MLQMEWLTVQQVADHLQVDPETVRRWIRAGELSGVLLSNQAGYRIEQAEVARFMERRRSAGDGRLRDSQ